MRNMQHDEAQATSNVICIAAIQEVRMAAMQAENTDCSVKGCCSPGAAHLEVGVIHQLIILVAVMKEAIGPFV